MATVQIVKVKVDALTKYGFSANGRYVGLSKQLPEADKARIVPGAEFEAEYYVADSGKEYLNKILAVTKALIEGTKRKSEAVTDVNPPVDQERAKKFTPKFTKTAATDNSMTRADWDAKDQRISRQGVIQAAVIALAPTVSNEILFESARALAEQMLAFVTNKGE
jgi:hypothetical protein